MGAKDNGVVDGLIGGIPDLITKVKDIFSKDKDEAEVAAEAAEDLD